MKSEKGVTLTSLIIYVIIMLVVIGIISIISTFFYNNIEEAGKRIDPSQEFTRFSSFFLKDMNKTDRDILECSEEGDYVVFSNGTQYTFKNNAIYRGKVKICEGIESLKFEKEVNEDEKNTIKVIYKLTKDTEEKTTIFTINN